MEAKFKDWQAPVFESLPELRQSWATEAIQEGESWLQSQTAFKNYEQNIALLSSDSTLSLKSNTLKPDIRKFVETIADVREIATYGGAEQFKEFISMFNRVVDNIYRTSHFPRQTRKALQYAMAGRGYIWPRFIRKEFGWGEGFTEFKPLALHEVLPVQLPSDHDIQGSYAVTIMDCLGVAEAHARFPLFQDKLLPVSKTAVTSNGQVRRLEWWDKYKFGNESKNWDSRYCEIRYTFVRDLRINRTGAELPMGDAGTSWYYKVPSLKGQVVGINPLNGLPESRTATEEDCRLYPQLRLIITNPGMTTPLYDGPAFDWHGMMPPIAYDVDDWPWMAVGFSLLQDVAGPERTVRKLRDQMMRVVAARLDPPKGYDLNAGIPREDIKNFDWLNERGTNVGVDGNPLLALVSLLPESVRVDETHFKFHELLEQIRQRTLGLNDIAALADLKFNLSSETADKILETIGPIAKGIAANMEVAHSKVAMQLKYMIPQYYSTRKLMALIGPDAVAAMAFDKQPDSIVPSHMPGEESLAQANKPSNKTQIERAKWFAQNLSVVTIPSFLLNVTQMQEQMKMLNFLQRGFPISFGTAFKKLAPDISWPDVPGKDELEKYEWEQRRLAQVKIDTMKAAAAELPPGAAPGGAAPGAGGGGEGGGEAGTSPHPGGRPPSGQAPPKLEMRGTKTGNPRTVVSQSK